MLSIFSPLPRPPDHSHILTTISRCYVTPLLGAYIADAHLGRYNTIIIAVGIALIGHIILIISAIPGVIEKSNTALGVFILAEVIMGFGALYCPLCFSPFKLRLRNGTIQGQHLAARGGAVSPHEALCRHHEKGRARHR
jgi:MFS family permease